ncbi:MAG: Biopolymer transport protein ExbD/TolR [Myxococcaceae bacterium]|nr:Biopolymer transport protein ExbD/TolR [Myxococcaceae bacterium]
MAGSSSQGDEIVGINVTPLVDITLVLLIIFMVTAKLVVSQAMPLDLPKAASAGEQQTMFTVSIDADGLMQANGTLVRDDEVLRRLAQAAQRESPELRAVLSASERVPHGRVMHALDVLRAVGISKVAFGAEKVETRQ